MAQQPKPLKYDDYKPDDTLVFETDAYQKRKFGTKSPFPDNVNKDIYLQAMNSFIANQYSLTDDERGNAYARIVNAKDRSTQQANEDQIKEYLKTADTLIGDGPETLLIRNFFNSIFPGTFERTTVTFTDFPPALKDAVKSGFTLRKTKDDADVVSISTQYMYSPSNVSSKYDKALLRDARSMVKKLSQVIRLVKSGKRKKNSAAFSQDTYVKRARYNELKYAVDPYARISLAKQRFNKYKGLDQQNYIAGIKAGMDKVRNRAAKTEEDSKKAYPYGNIYLQSERDDYLSAKGFKKSQQIKQSKNQPLAYKGMTSLPFLKQEEEPLKLPGAMEQESTQPL